MSPLVVSIIVFEACLAYIILYFKGPLSDFRSAAVFALLITAAFALRFVAIDYETDDYRWFLSQWVEFYRTNGGFEALRHPVGNYNYPYMYFLAAISYLNLRDLHCIKLFGFLFDILMAYYSMRICSKLRPDSRACLYVFPAALLLPTAFLNCAVWGQCDSIYISLMLMGISLALDEKPIASMIAAGISFSFKLQAIFILPVYAVLLFNRKFKVWHFLLFPLTYVLMNVPAVISGRPLYEALSICFSQTGSIGTGLNYNSPSVFAIFDGYGGLPEIQNTENAAKLGIIAAFVYMVILLVFSLIRRSKLTDYRIVVIAALLSIGIPFLLPHMHDRYFFGADILCLVLCFAFPRFIPCAVLTQFASLLGYHAYLKMRYLLMMRYGAYALIITLVLLITMFTHEDSGIEQCHPGSEISSNNIL